MEKYGRVKRSEVFETRMSGSVVLKFLNDEIKKDLRSKSEGWRN